MSLSQTAARFQPSSPTKAGLAALHSLNSVPLGSVVRVTGICAMDNASPFGHNVPFNILMRTIGVFFRLTHVQRVVSAIPKRNSSPSSR